MAAVILPKRWFNKPPLGVQLKNGHPLANGLVGAWLMNEAGGIKVYDLVNRTPGTLSGTLPLWKAGRFGGAISFGSSGYIDLGTATSASFSFTDNFTANCWFMVPSGGSYAANGGLITHANSGAPQNGWGLETNGAAVLVFGSYNAASPFNIVVNGSTNPAAGSGWHMLTGIIRNGTRYLYLDGVLQTNTDTHLPAANTTINGVIGRFYGNASGLGWANYLDMPAVWNYGLYSEQVLQLWEDPFCFMQPQAPNIRYFIPSGAAPPPPSTTIFIQDCPAVQFYPIGSPV
jgi:hypothetical protein